MKEEGKQIEKLRDILIKNILEKIERSYLTGHPEKRLPNNASFRFAGIASFATSMSHSSNMEEVIWVNRVGEILKATFQNIQRIYDSKTHITGVATGYDRLDRFTGGFQPSDLLIVAGRPSMGKTTLAMNMAENAAIKHDIPVVIFSMEMSAQQLVRRMFSSLGQIDQTRLRTGKLDDLNKRFRDHTNALFEKHGT